MAKSLYFRNACFLIY